MIAVKYEACLEDGTLIAKSDGVEFTVKEGMFFVFYETMIPQVGCWLYLFNAIFF